MGRRFAELAFTPHVKQQQEKHGSRHLYERVEQSNALDIVLGRTSSSLFANGTGSTWRR